LIELGAYLVGETAPEREFWERARKQAGSLFDVTDFNVAAALEHLAGYAIEKGYEVEGIVLIPFS